MKLLARLLIVGAMVVPSFAAVATAAAPPSPTNLCAITGCR